MSSPRRAKASLATRTASRQILLNLVGNGIKFTEKGSVSVEVTATPAESAAILVNISLKPSAVTAATLVRFEVIDSGIGMPEDVSTKMFERFSQADSSATRRYGGTVSASPSARNWSS